MPTLHNPNWFKHALNHGFSGLVLLQPIIITEFLFGVNLPSLFIDIYELLLLSIINFLSFRSFRLHYGLTRDFGKILKPMSVCSIAAYSGLNLEILLIDIFGPKDFVFFANLFILFLSIAVAVVFAVFISAVLYAINPGSNELETN